MPATGATSFTINVALRKEDATTEVLRARLADLSPVFDAFISSWAAHNSEKFGFGEGAEETGVQFEPDPMWEPLTVRYMKDKRRRGFGNHLMVRTGELRRVLTSEDAFFKMTDTDRAFFGAPQDDEDEVKVRGNWNKRQAIFLDSQDKRKLEKLLLDYLHGDPGFAGRAPMSVQAANNAIWAMNAEMRMVVDGSGGPL